MDQFFLMAVALLPGVVIAALVWWHDRYDREPHDLLIGCFFWGALITLPVAVVQNMVTHFMDFSTGGLLLLVVYAFAVVALSEEGAKFAVVRLYVFKRHEFDEPYDGIMYTVMVGMGFATVENVLFILGQESDQQWSVALLRMITAVPAHGANAVIMGYFLGIAKFHSDTRIFQFVALTAAVVAHGFYDTFLFVGNGSLLAFGAVVVLVVTIIFGVRAVRLHKQRSPFRS